MATILISPTLNVVAKYISVLDESLGVDSIYIHTKNMLTELITKGNLTSAESGKVISEVLGALNTSVVNAALSTALDWAKAEKDVELKVKELEYQTDVLAQQKLLDAAKTNQINADITNSTLQANKLYGSGGKVDKEIALMSQQILSAVEETRMMTSKVKESQASVYKLVADTMANFGPATYTVGDSGVSGSVNMGAGTLGYSQLNIATKQAAGYSYNAWANAAQACASMASMEVTEGITGGPGYQLLSAAASQLIAAT